ncbi:MFS transporter [Halalkalirubrum salinum]|uniref:MFS transporter n=1 Tax=Halalkalirubrum salinum TaxID=2563889 RepID=UPI0010FBA506|nr:MFS transporter [Halalkalirubrum salinum]
MDRNSRSIVVFTSVSHAMVHTYELSIPILVAIWLVEFPVSTAVLGAVVSIGYALFGIGALPGGILTDRFGSRTLIVGCLIGMGLSFLFLSFATGILTIAFALAVWGMAASVYHPAGLSLISKGVDNRGSAFAYHGMAGNIGIAFGPLVTALLLLTLDWRMATRLLAVPTAIVIGYALTVEFDETAAVSVDGGTDRSESTTDSDTMSLFRFITDSRALFTTGFALAMVIVMMNGLFYRGMLTFLPDVLDQFLPPIQDYIQLFDPDSPIAEEFTLSSYVYVGLLTIGISGQYVGGKLSDRISSTTGLAIVFGALVVVAIAFVPAARGGLSTLLIVSALLGFFLFALQPLYQATIADHSPPGDRGLSYGYTYLMSFGIGAAGAAIAGLLLSVTTTDGTFLALAVFPALGSLFAITLSRRDRTRKSKST